MNASQMNWESESEQAHTNVFVLVHRMLRGKYILTLVLASIFGLIGGSLGYMSQEPQFKSVGVIRIQPTLPKVLYDSEQSTAPKMFSSFVSSQAELIRNGDVIQNAIEDDVWKAVSHLSNISSASDVQRRLSVRPDRRAQEIITVSFNDENPLVSTAIVSSVMNAYLAKYGKEGSIDNPEIVNALKKRRVDLMAQRDSLDSQIANKVSTVGTENLTPLIQNSLLKIRQMDAERKKYADQLAMYEQIDSSTNSSGSDSMSLEDAMIVDPMIADLVNRRNGLVDAREEMMISEGLREEHRDVRRITLMIENAQVQIDKRLEDLQSGDMASIPIYEDGKQILSQNVLNARIARVDESTGLERGKLAQLNTMSINLESLKEDRSSVQQSISEVNRRLDQIDTESQVDNMKDTLGKISIAGKATNPREPTSDPRKKLALVGFAGASSIPIFVVLGLGYFSHKIQYSDDNILSGASSGIIGMLPDLGASLANQELATASAFAVHQIRSQLQIKSKVGESQVYCVTSPAPQDGKTSMIIALGLSFAESGDRTLLLDLDFIGRGLSVHFGYPNAESLAEAIDSEDQTDTLIRETDFDGLHILPAGYGDDERVSRLAPRSVAKLINHVRKNYDTILIDTGPILGSVEAVFVAPQADGVIMVVGRGQYKPLVKKAIDQVNAVEGNIIATVFNRASIHELREASSSMSVHFSRQVSRQQEDVDNRPTMRVGPVAGSLFSAKAKNIDTQPPRSTGS